MFLWAYCEDACNQDYLNNSFSISLKSKNYKTNIFHGFNKEDFIEIGLTLEDIKEKKKLNNKIKTKRTRENHS